MEWYDIVIRVRVPQDTGIIVLDCQDGDGESIEEIILDDWNEDT